MTPERFAKGMTFHEYVTFVGTPENLARESSPLTGSAPRRDWSGFLRERYETTRLTDAQMAAMKWLAAQPGGPAKVLAISEDWSSDCRRDVPYLQRLAEAGGLEMRIFTRDGQNFLKGRPSPAESPNADLMLQYMNKRGSEEFASIPVAVFFDGGFHELYRYIEFPAIYHKDRLVAKIRGPRAGETPEQTNARGTRDFFAMLATPLYDVWASAGIDEILSALHRRALGAT